MTHTTARPAATMTPRAEIATARAIAGALTILNREPGPAAAEMLDAMGSPAFPGLALQWADDLAAQVLDLEQMPASTPLDYRAARGTLAPALRHLRRYR